MFENLVIVCGLMICLAMCQIHIMVRESEEEAERQNARQRMKREKFNARF